MAQWKETLEPYVKVYERVKKAAINPVAGEDLVIGVSLISDAGPANPTLITSQSEFINMYASGELSEDYLKGLDCLYEGDMKNLPSVMWANAYRLAGSSNLLVTRATKADDMFFSKPIKVGADLNDYLLRDGEMMKKIPMSEDNKLKIVIDTNRDSADSTTDGWLINVDGVGKLGNLVGDDGPAYDYLVNTLPELIEKLNETTKFFSPSFKFYEDEKGSVDKEIKDPFAPGAKKAKSVIFDELYLGSTLLNKGTDVGATAGLNHMVICESDWEFDPADVDQRLIDINSAAYSGFDLEDEGGNYYVTNVYNTSSDLKVRIRRFNHDAVAGKDVSDLGDSPWTVLEGPIGLYTTKGIANPTDENILERDFYEFCVEDPSVSDSPLIFNIGNIIGRGDVTVAEMNESLNMVNFNLPEDLNDLGLNYYGYEYNPVNAEKAEIEINLGIDPEKHLILKVNDTDLKKAIDKIALDEIYVVEGLCDLGNTEPSYQNYLANLAIIENYFYPVSTIQSSNYLTIANSAARIAQDSYKLYLSAPWDIDTGTFGFRTVVSPSVLYWEAVARNRRNNSEFAPILGQSTGIVQYQNPAVEFNKKTRQLLLSKRINTVLWNNQTNAWNMNDNFTKQSIEDVMSDDGNSRLAIRISKAMPVILKQFIGWKISPRLWNAAIDVVKYWFRSTITPMAYTIDDYRVQIDEDNNPEELQKQNKMKVNIYVRYQRSLKYVLVYHDILDVGMDLS